MALLQCSFYSEALQLQTSINVILPTAKWNSKSKRKVPKHQVLYLLHGLSGDHSDWSRKSSIERYVEGLDLAVIMPEVGRSFYTDMASGGRYFTFVAEELPAVVHSLFHLSDRREDTFAAGLSMGGYGAFKLALTFPQRFAAAASFSGALDMVTVPEDPKPEFVEEMCWVFGNLDAIQGSPNDLFHLAEKMVQSKKPHPRFYQWCGTEDFLIDANHRFGDHALELGLKLDYSESPGGHTWDHWDEQIQQALIWFNLKAL
jgi:putative tributyrin esterase